MHKHALIRRFLTDMSRSYVCSLQRDARSQCHTQFNTRATRLHRACDCSFGGVQVRTAESISDYLIYALSWVPWCVVEDKTGQCQSIDNMKLYKYGTISETIYTCGASAFVQ